MMKKKRGLNLVEVSLYTIPEDMLLDIPVKELNEMADRILMDFNVDLMAPPEYTKQELDEKYKDFMEKIEV